MDGNIPVDIEKTAAWITAHRLDLRKEAGIQICQMIAEALRDERSRRDAELALVSAQREWMKDRLSDLQLPSNSQKNIEEWLAECGMPTALNESREGE